MENRLISHELEEMKIQIDNLKKKLEDQTIVNEKHIRNSFRTKISDINRTVTMTVIAGIFALVYCTWFFHFKGLSLAFTIATGLMLAVCVLLTLIQKIQLSRIDISAGNLVETARDISKIRTHYTSAQFYDRRHPRTAIGKDDSGNIYLVVIDGRFKGKADGASIFETAYICHLLGMTDAINLDGGGSSALWSRETGVINHPRDNRKFDHEGERSVPNLVVVY